MKQNPNKHAQTMQVSAGLINWLAYSSHGTQEDIAMQKQIMSKGKVLNQ